jgi:hypothetical protein
MGVFVLKGAVVEIVWYGAEQFSGLLQSGNISFLAVPVLIILIGLVRYYINKG